MKKIVWKKILISFFGEQNIKRTDKGLWREISVEKEKNFEWKEWKAVN